MSQLVDYLLDVSGQVMTQLVLFSVEYLLAGDTLGKKRLQRARARVPGCIAFS